MTTRGWFSRIRAVFARSRAERDLHDEMDFHLIMQAKKHMDAGLAKADALARARAEFGSVELTKEDARDVRAFRWLEEFFQDARVAARGFARAPLFALTVILTIALGLGLNTAVFTAFDAYILRPFAVRNPHALADFVWRDQRGFTHALTRPEYQLMQRDNPAFAESFGYMNMVARVGGQPVFGQFVTGNYFSMLGVGPSLGRTLQPEDALIPGAGAVTVLSHAAWEGRFAGDSSIIGRTIVVRGVPLLVVGVARDGFGGLESRARDLWIPLTMASAMGLPDPFDAVAPAPLGVVGQMRASLTLDAARSALTAWTRSTITDRPPKELPSSAWLVTRETPIPLVGETVVIFAPIVVAFGLVLLLACANVANMMLARGMARQREIGICLSLGATRGRLIRQLLTESLMLALPAAALGFLISSAAIDGGVRLLFAALPANFAPLIRIVPLHTDVRVFAFMIGGAVASALLFGLAPALQATRPSIVQTARGNFDNEFRPSRLRNALVVAQITICVVLIAAAGVMLRSSAKLQQTDSGMRTHDIVHLVIQDRHRAEVVAALRAHPLVETVASARSTPIDALFGSAPLAPGSGVGRVAFNIVSPEYFTALELPVVRGRNFLPDEAASSVPVAIVTESTARKLWGSNDPIGQIVRLETPATGSVLTPFKTAHVVGVVRDVVSGVLYDPPTNPLVFFPGTPEAPGVRLIVRTRGAVETARRTLDSDIERAMPGSIDQIRLLDEYVAAQAFPMRIAYWISSVVGGIALLLTLSGIYGVLSYIVAQRTREIGIRMSLGADRRAVVALVLRQSARLALMGLAIGSLIALALTRAIASELQSILTFDLAAFSVGPALVVAASLIAAFFPARRATRVEPIIALRQD
ncbi:MAG TPA: ADOP family duplicated permease [Gemmatimonadaceae bacterium]|nr:ADOP family duplicated permease [Gemmatimonadaceae bacterium]